MKIPDPAEVVVGANGMKPESGKPKGIGSGKTRVPMGIPHIPMEWMDPMSWRLPSGKALAEFALQAGFLAPLMLGTPKFKKKKTSGPLAAPMVRKRAEEVPERTGTFPETR